MPAAGFLHARADAPDEGLLEDRRRPCTWSRDDLLDLVEQRLALLAVELLGLALEEIVDLGQRAVGVDAVLGRRTARAAPPRCRPRRWRRSTRPVQLLLAPAGHEGGALHRPHAASDADGLRIAADRLAQRGVGRQRGEIAGVEAVGVAGLGQELLGPRGIVARAARSAARTRRCGGTKAPVDLPKPSISAWLMACAVDGEAGGQPHAPIGPRRLRIPLVEEVQPEDAVDQRRGDAGCPACACSSSATAPPKR